MPRNCRESVFTRVVDRPSLLPNMTTAPITKGQVVDWPMGLPESAAFVTRANPGDYWPCAGGLSAVNDIGTQIRDVINSGLTRRRFMVAKTGGTSLSSSIAESGRK